jgi:hypothetical protein
VLLAVLPPPAAAVNPQIAATQVFDVSVAVMALAAEVDTT